MQIISFYNNPNIGLFFYTTDKYTIIPSITPDKTCTELKKELKTEIITSNVYNSSVNNIFLAGNEKLLFAPKIITAEENKSLSSIKDLKLIVLDTKLNALGNNLVFKENKVLVNPNFEEPVIKRLEDLGLKVLKTTIAGVETVGANIILFGNTALVNPEIKPGELKKISEFLSVKCEKGTVNNKSNIVKAGLLVNKNGVIVSNAMTGPEMMTIEGLWRDGYEKN